ncbi:MAG TPA: beta family protein [Ardenticatenaceae bacterium]|jgi:hypothetical protein
MFDHAHYVPILRWKRGERLALCYLTPEISELITPLIEIVPKAVVRENSLGKLAIGDKLLEATAKDIFEHWGQRPFFLDLILLDPILRSFSKLHPLEVLGREGRRNGLWMVPVTGLWRDDAYQSAAKALVRQDQRGLCIRIHRKDIEQQDFKHHLTRLCSNFSLRYSQIDLVIDYQLIDKEVPNIAKIMKRIPQLQQWRTVTFICGTFLKYVSALEKNEQHTLPRTEWLAWREQIVAMPQGLRKPSYGDYTVQYPLYEPVRSGPPHISASIRYASTDYWVIMRGEDIFNPDGPGHQGYIGNAMLLIEREEFCGEDCCYGCAYIQRMAAQAEETGNPGTWILAGISHHLTTTARQIANLSVTSVTDEP